MRLVLAHFWVAVTAFALGSMMAVMQALARAGVRAAVRHRRGMYYLSVTAHGVLLALVFTTFFIMALGYLVAEIDARPRRRPGLGVGGVLDRGDRHA